MSKALPLTQRQVRALCEGAKKAGFAPIIQIGEVLVRLVPQEFALPEAAKEKVDEKGEGYL